jgi:hypothetical protein
VLGQRLAPGELAGAERLRQLEQGQGVAAGLVDQPVPGHGAEPAEPRLQQPAGRLGVEPADGELGQAGGVEPDCGTRLGLQDAGVGTGPDLGSSKQPSASSTRHSGRVRSRPPTASINRRYQRRRPADGEGAAALFLSEKTVETHLRHLFGKLGVSSPASVGRALAGGAGPDAIGA